MATAAASRNTAGAIRRDRAIRSRTVRRAAVLDSLARPTTRTVCLRYLASLGVEKGRATEAPLDSGRLASGGGSSAPLPIE